MQQALNMLFSILRTADALNRYLRIELQKHGVTSIQFAITNALYVHDGRMTPTEISKWVFRSKHTITSDLYTLEKGGYIRREAGENRRSVHIVMTQKGRDKTSEILPYAQEMSRKALSCFDKDEKNTLMILQKQFRKHLGEKIVNSKEEGKSINSL